MMDKKRYPANWNEISRAARQRANNKCEACGVDNGRIIVRSEFDPARYLEFNTAEREYYTPDGAWLYYIPEEYEHAKHVTIVLTVHHADKCSDGTPCDPHDKMDCRPERLQALCQRCHLLADLPSHISNAKRTRAKKRTAQLQAAGQAPLILNEEQSQ